MRTWRDVLFVSLLLACFLCFVVGYALMIRHVWQMPDRKERLKTLFTKNEPLSNYPPTGPRLLAIGAILGVITFCGFGVFMLTFRP